MQLTAVFVRVIAARIHRKVEGILRRILTIPSSTPQRLLRLVEARQAAVQYRKLLGLLFFSD